MLKHTTIRAALAIIFAMAFSFPAAAQSIYVAAPWGCPTADGPISIAKAARDGTNIGLVAEANNCEIFPYPIPVDPVRFIVETENGNGFVYVWELRAKDSNMLFFGYTDPEVHGDWMKMKKTSI